MKRIRPQNPFELENLEPRILLSNDFLVGAVPAAAPAGPNFPNSIDMGQEIPQEILSIEEIAYSQATSNQTYQQPIQYDPSKNVADIFAGLTEIESVAGQDGDASSDAAPATAKTSSGADTEVAAESSLTDQAISEGEKLAIIAGIAELANLGADLESFDAFGDALPLTDGTTAGRLLKFHEVLDSRLASPVYDYFSDVTDPPTVAGLLAVLQGNYGSTDAGLTVCINAVSVGSGDVKSEISIVVDLDAAGSGTVGFNAGALGDKFQFEFAEGTKAAYTTEIAFDFSFGVEHKEGSEAFYVEFHELTADLTVTADSLKSEAAGNAVSGMQVVDGSMALEAHANVRFDEAIAGDGRITPAELRGITPETIGDLVHLTAVGAFVAQFTLASNPGAAEQNGPVVYLDIRSDNLFAGIPPQISISVDISALKYPILDLMKGLSEAGRKITDFQPLNVTLPVIDASINEIFSENAGIGLGKSLDLYTPSLEYFTLLEAFNFDINSRAAAIGALPGIDTANFDINVDAHRLKLENLLEKSFNLSLSPNWDPSLYMPEIWSLLNPDFQVNDYLPRFQALLGLPYVPVMDKIRSDIKSYFGAFPSLKGLLDYIRVTGQKSLFNGFSGQHSTEPFVLKGNYIPEQNAVRFDFYVDATRQVDLAANLEGFFADRFQDLGISFESDLAFTVTLGLKLDFSATVSSEEASLMMREAYATVQVKEEIDGLGVTLEALPGANLVVSEGRFNFDSRVEFVFHGLDPPASGAITLSALQNAPGLERLINIQTSGTLSLELPATSKDPAPYTLYIYLTSDNVFDSKALNFSTNLVVASQDPNQAIGIGSDTSGDFLLDQTIVDLFSGFDSVSIGRSDGSHVVEIGNSNGSVTLNNPLVISTPQPGGEVHIFGAGLSVNGDLTIIGSGHTTTIGGGTLVSDPPGTVSGNPTVSLTGGVTIVQATGDLTISDAVVINGNVRIVAGGNITINNPGTISGNNDGIADTLTLEAGGFVDVQRHIAGDDLASVSIISGGAVSLAGTVTLSGSLTINAGGEVDIAAAAAAGGFSSKGTTFDNLGAGIATVDRSIVINHSGAVTIGGALSAGAGAVDIDSTGSTIALNSNITTTTGNVTLDASGTTTVAVGVIITTTTGAVTFGGSGTGGLQTAGSVVTESGSVVFNRAVTLDGILLVNTGEGVNSGTIEFRSTLDGGYDAILLGSVTLQGAVGGGAALTSLQISGETRAVNANAAISAGSMVVENAGAVLLKGTVTVPSGFQSGGTTFDNTGATITTTDTAITIKHTQAVTVTAALSSGTGDIAVTSSGAGIFLAAGITTSGGKVFLSAGTTLITTANGTITTRGADNAVQGTGGGEVLICSTGPGAITVGAEITAAGGNTTAGNNKGGNAGVVTVLNTDGAIVIHSITAKGGTATGTGSPGADGTVQIQVTANGTVSQQNGTRILAGALKIIASGAVTLANAANDVQTIAADITGGANLTYTGAVKVTIGSIDAAGTGSAAIPKKAGVAARGGNGAITIQTVDGDITVDQQVSAERIGVIVLWAQGKNNTVCRDILINAAVVSATGNITVEASGVVIVDAEKGGKVTTTPPGQGAIISHEVVPEGLTVSLSGDFEWVEQGPSLSQGGQVTGMDAQGNAVSAAIQSIYVHPTNPSVVYVGTVSGGLWRTLNINATKKVEPVSPTKAKAPDVSALVLAEQAGGSLTQQKLYRYKIVFVDSVGDESNASDFKAFTLTGANAQIQLQGFPIGHPGTSRRRIYRTVGLDPANPGEPTYRLVGEVNDNTTLNYTDNTADNALGAEREIAVPSPVWEPLTDDYPSLAVGAFAFDSNNPNIFYVGTGSVSSSSRGGASVGLLKTTDNGATFKVIGDTENEFKGIKVRDIVTHNYTVGTPFATYDARNKRLTVFFKPNDSTAARLRDIVNAVANCPLSVELFQGSNSGEGTFANQTFEHVTQSGTNTTPAIGAIFPAGGNNAITFTAVNNGEQYNDLKVIFTAGGTKGSETVVYDANTKTLTIAIAPGSGPGASTANTVVAAINTVAQGQSFSQQRLPRTTGQEPTLPVRSRERPREELAAPRLTWFLIPQAPTMLWCLPQRTPGPPPTPSRLSLPIRLTKW